ncbi:MAG: class I SAM-dependent methyltransferase [Kofleriaceae bacterium]|nr:class I SAM-dependent methyltransferase [Kofleriaceae bacterium]
MKLRTSLLVLSLSVGACKKEAPKAEPETKTPAPAVAVADAGPTDAEKVAKKIADDQAAAEKEKARWTPELESAAIALRDKASKDNKEALTAILASDHRTPGAKDRDAARHPLETLVFFGVTPASTVVELGAGGGWYTEILAPFVGAKGKLIVAGPDANGPADKMTTAYGKSLDLFLAKSKLFDKVERVNIGPSIKLGEDGKADVVIAMREMHNWQRRGELDAYLAAIHAALKDGGTFGLEAHRAKPGTKGEDTAESGYLAEDWVIAKVEAAGFKLADKSEVNANPKDTKDYAKGVWTLPPNFREGDKDKEKYAAIGESDRMTLKFTKIAKPATP